MADIQSTSTAQAFIKAHVDARLSLPITTRPYVTLDAPKDRVVTERLFRGFLACLSGHTFLTLHVWDIRRPALPTKILTIAEPHIRDVVIEPEDGLLALLYYKIGYIYQLFPVIHLKLLYQERYRNDQASGLMV